MATSAATVSRRRFLPVVKGRASVRISVAVIVALAVVALAAPLIAPYDPNAGNLRDTLSGTSGDHLLGTDANGRDILSRVIYGGRTTLLGPLLVVVLSTAIGVPLGLIAGYRGGLFDSVVGRGWDVLLSFPALLLAILIVASFGVGFWTAVISITIVYVPILGRVVRGAVVVEREKPYADAIRVQGLGSFSIVVHHMLPNIAPILLAQATLNFGFALLDLAGLAFLGLGVQPPTADWGQMLTTGRDSLVLGSYFEVLAASSAILLVVISFNILGDALAARTEAVQ